MQSSVQFSSATQSCPTLCDPMNHSTPGLPVHHQLLEFTQTHVHRVGDAIQLSHPLLSPSPLSIRVFSNKSILRMRWPKYRSKNIKIACFLSSTGQPIPSGYWISVHTQVTWKACWHTHCWASPHSSWSTDPGRDRGSCFCNILPCDGVAGWSWSHTL